eukprot:COSAG05_NODE_11007_length_535_cov_0.616972_1_plen_163_part_10
MQGVELVFPTFSCEPHVRAPFPRRLQALKPQPCWKRRAQFFWRLIIPPLAQQMPNVQLRCVPTARILHQNINCCMVAKAGSLWSAPALSRLLQLMASAASCHTPTCQSTMPPYLIAQECSMWHKPWVSFSELRAHGAIPVTTNGVGATILQSIPARQQEVAPY